MDWRSYYRSRLKTVDEVAKTVKSNERIYCGFGAADSAPVMEALMRRADEFRNVEVYSGFTMSKGEYFAPQYAKSFHHGSGFLSPYNRNRIPDGYGYFRVAPFHLAGRHYLEKLVPIQKMFITVSPPDNSGYVSFGVSVDQQRTVLEVCDYAVAVINERMPRTAGDSHAHVTEFDAFVEATHELYTIPLIENDSDVVERVGKNVAALVQDGDCIQMGIGEMPNVVLKYLTDKKDLSVHTEVFADNLLPLIEKGIITGTKNNLHPRKIGCTFIMGTRDLYDYVDNNHILHMAPVHINNYPPLIASIDNMVSINTCLTVDLMGQVASETIGARQYSGIGGQLDFMQGAMDSKNGRAILAMSSTTKNDTVSRIVPMMPYGTPLSATRNHVEWIVTEYGAVKLFGANHQERAKLLISIAHPKFREDLEKQFKEYSKGNVC